MEQPSIPAGEQIDGAAPYVRPLAAMLEAMRNAPPRDPQRAARVIPVRPTPPATSAGATSDPGDPDDPGAGRSANRSG